NDRQFRRLCEVIGAPQLADDPRFATTGDRTAHRAELRPLLAGLLAARPSAEWFDLLIAAGVPCGPLNTVDARVEVARRVGPRPGWSGPAGSGWGRSPPRARAPTAYRPSGPRSTSPRRRRATHCPRRRWTSMATRSASGSPPRPARCRGMGLRREGRAHDRTG